METFVIPSSNPHLSRLLKLARWCALFAMSAMMYFIGETVLDGPGHSVRGKLFVALLWSLFMCASSRFWVPWRSASKPQSITIDGDMIVVKSNAGFYKLPFGDIQTFFEKKANFFSDGGLVVSEKTPSKAQFMGRFVWIPAYTPDYAYLKSIIELRKSSKSTG